MTGGNDQLRAAILRAHARWSTGSAKRFPPEIEWEPLAQPVGTGKPKSDQELTVEVPTVPTVPTAKEEVRTASPPMTPEQEERAAILEYESGLDRASAEYLARMSAVSD